MAAQANRPEQNEVLAPGIVLSHVAQWPAGVAQNLFVVQVDLGNPHVRFGVGLARGTALGREPTSAQAVRYGALVAVNGDFGAALDGDDFPQGLTVQDGELVTSPKYRTGLGISVLNQVYIGKWLPSAPPSWSWPATVTDAHGHEHPITHYNQACEPGWLSVYSDRYSDPPRSPAHRWDDACEVQLNAQDMVVRTASPAVGLPISRGGRVLVGRGSAAAWLAAHAQRGDKVSLNLPTSPDWRRFHTVLGGGPQLLAAGRIVSDMNIAFDGIHDVEDFELSFKRKYYETRHPRTLVGVSQDNRTLWLVVADGRAEGRSGLTLCEAAQFLLEQGAHDALQLDGGGSSTLVVRGRVRNVPSDGRERPVANALLLFYDG